MRPHATAAYMHACRELFQLLKSTCLHCYRLRLMPHARDAHIRKLRLLLGGRLAAAAGIAPPPRPKRAKKRTNAEGDADEAMDQAVVGEDAPAEDEEAEGHGQEGNEHQSPITSNVLAELQVTSRSTNACKRCVPWLRT